MSGMLNRFMKGGSSSPSLSEEKNLSLVHLKKLYAELRHVNPSADGNLLEDKLYRMVPLFIKVFKDYNSQDIANKFSDVNQFCAQVSHLLVDQIRRRAMNQSTERAGSSIVQFLEEDTSGVSSKGGWPLLQVLDVLSQGGSILIDCMISASLPSTMVKCLYLFFDLPTSQSPGSASSCSKNLQKLFIQILIQVCSTSAGPAEELARKDDLQLLFNAISSPCPAHNMGWRKGASDVLMAVSRKGLSMPVIQYIQNKDCISTTMSNMGDFDAITPMETVEMLVAIFCFLKDSSDVSQKLLEDFKIGGGYKFLIGFLLRLESDESGDVRQTLRNLVLLIGSLCTCGYEEIQLVHDKSRYKGLDVDLSGPRCKGVTVRNLDAYQVLQDVFLKAQSDHLCSTLLDVMSSIYCQDTTNYFLLEPHHSLSIFASVITEKSKEVQKKYFSMFELISKTLMFIPYKELSSLSLLLKTNKSLATSVLCTKTLHEMVTKFPKYKDVFREVGLVDVLVTCLIRFSSTLRETQRGDGIVEISEEEKTLAFYVMEILTIYLTNADSSSISSFNECGGIKSVELLLNFDLARPAALTVMKQVLVSPTPTGVLENLFVCLTASAPSPNIRLKIDTLRVFNEALEESHQTRITFRRKNGHAMMLRILAQLKGSLASPPSQPWVNESTYEILEVIRLTLSTLCSSMKKELANRKDFERKRNIQKFVAVLQDLGCFTGNKWFTAESLGEVAALELQPDLMESIKDAFYMPFCEQALKGVSKRMDSQLLYSCIIFRFLVNMVLDKFTLRAGFQVRNSKFGETFSPSSELCLQNAACVVVIIRLFPAISSCDSKLGLHLLSHLSDVLLKLSKSVQSQQRLCQAGLIGELLDRCSVAVYVESHPLYASIQHVFERLSSQVLAPYELRTYLRLGHPLKCQVPCRQYPVPTVPMSTVTCLVSIATTQGTDTSREKVNPSFVEFDMRREGWACLFIPSLAPKTAAATPTGVTSGSDGVLLGGVGRGERAFPPSSGLTFSTWFNLQCVPSGSEGEDQPIRLLQVVRKVSGKEAGPGMVCLYVYLRPRDRTLVVSTRESPFVGDLLSGVTTSDGVVCFGVPRLFDAETWNNVIVVLQKSGLLRYSSVSLYVNGDLHSSEKLRYISANIQQPGSAFQQHSVYAFIGTPPGQQSSPSQLVWQQGPLCLSEEVYTAAIVTKVHSLGSNYLGNYQSVSVETQDADLMVNGTSLLAEEKLIIGIHPYYHTLCTVDSFKKKHSSRDCKVVCKQLQLAHEGETSLILLPNVSSHLVGSARSFGAFMSCHSGSRVFTPKPLSYSFNLIGGVSVLLGLVAMASDVDGLYASLKVLVCIVKSSRKMQLQMDTVRGYQILSMLFKKKQKLLNSHILHLTLVLVGTVESSQEVSAITNKTAFEDLLCDVETWHQAPGTLFLVLYDHFTELLTSTRDNNVNSRIMNEAGLMDKLLFVLGTFDHEAHIYRPICDLIFLLVRSNQNPRGLSSLGKFLLTTLPKYFEGSLLERDGSPSHSTSNENVGQVALKVSLRNYMLDKLFELLTNKRTGFNVTFSEKLLKVLSFDFFYAFLRKGLHDGTVVLSLRVLFLLIDNTDNRKKFSEGSLMGGWLRNPEDTTASQEGVLQEFGVEPELSNDMNLGACEIPGFLRLQWLLQDHADITPLYFMLAALTCGYKAFYPVPSSKKLTLDNLCEYVTDKRDEKSKSTSSKWCIEAAVIILCMVRKKLLDSDDIHRCRHAVHVLQFMQFLYTKESEFKSLSQCPSFLAALISLLSYMDKENPASQNPLEEGLTTAYRPDQIVKEYFKQLFMDIFASSFKKSANIVDLMLEKIQDFVDIKAVVTLQVYVLNLVMSHFRDVGILNAESASLQGYRSSEQSNITSNAVVFTSKVVDKLWSGIEVKGVYIFMKEMIYQAKRRASGTSMDSIYRNLNRTVLYEMYQIGHVDDKAEAEGRVGVLLNKLLADKSIVLGPANFDVEFLGCITHFLVAWGRDGCVPESSNTTWHVVPFTDGNNASATALLCQKVWNEMYILKKNAIEEVLHQSFTETSSPDLSVISTEATQAAEKVWAVFVDKEMKNKTQEKENFHYLTNKIHKVGTGVLKVAMGRQTKAEIPMFCGCEFSKVEVDGWTAKHIALVAERFESLYHTFLLDQKHMVNILMEEWSELETELLRERGVWGPQVDSHLEKWMLDMTEGRDRMRRRMKKNELFYLHYPHQETLTKHTKYRPPVSRDSESYCTLQKPIHLIANTEPPMTAPPPPPPPVFLDYPESETTSDQDQVPSLRDLPGKRRSGGEEGSELPEGSPREQADGDGRGDLTDLESMADSELSSGLLNDDLESLLATNQTLARLIGNKEQIVEVHRCAKIQGLESVEGLLLFGKQKYYIVDGFTLQNGKEITTIDGITDEEWTPIIPKSTYTSMQPSSTLKASSSSVSSSMQNGSLGPAQECFAFLYEDIREVLKMWYVLQPIALEIFSADGRNFLLAFGQRERKKIQTKLISLAPYLTTSHASKAGQSQSTRIEQGPGLISNIMGDKSVTTRWERGEISNFQYLMYLNTLAGRSYNDLMQYPVFPWVLADYDSEELDLTNPATFRNFSQPMGAQTEARLKQFQKRFKEWDDPTEETSAYHYGTHYSSAMIVASYLIRLEPFAQFFLKLQGGHFDLADRLFHSIKDAWVSSSFSNMADVKELIPEFFYLPEFLSNSNNFDLGTKQSGIELGDIILPPWSKGDPVEFIRQHRRALECDYVSAHLHEWIDLIFGYKQVGLHAEEANNVFHPLFYEGSVDIYSIDDPVRRNAIIGFINNFGQVPKQLFKRPHSQKKIMSESGDLSAMLHTNQLLFYQSPENLKPDLTPIKELKKAVGQILCTDHTVYAVEKGRLLVTGSSAAMRYIKWNLTDLSIQICDYDTSRILSTFECCNLERVECSILINDRTVATAGSSLAVQVWSLQIDKGQPRMILKHSLFGHTNTIHCLATSPSYQLLASGSADGTCILWDTLRLKYIRQLPRQDSTIFAVSINDVSGTIATCSGSKLNLWTINGDMLGQVDTAVHVEKRSINCVIMTEMREWDTENLILTGGTDGVVRMWGVEYVKSKKEELEWKKSESADGPGYHLWSRQLLLRSKLTLHTAFERKDNREPSPITALAISKDHKTVFVGDEKGRLYSWSLTSDPGSVATDQWVMDSSSTTCEGCQATFTFTNRRHHCRDCGKLFCYRCSKYVSEIPALKTPKPVRVCSKCFRALQQKTSRSS